MPVKVSVLLAVKVLPSAIVNVEPVAGAVMATLLMLVADATPNVGVTSVGLVANTNEPVPVSSVMAEIKLALDGVAKKVATPVPNPEIPVDTGRPVQLVNVPDEGVPRAGVTRVGLVDRTALPVPVMAANSMYSASQSAAVVKAVPIHKKLMVTPGITVATKLPPDEFTVKLPVEAFSIRYITPAANVLVTGRTTV